MISCVVVFIFVEQQQQQQVKSSKEKKAKRMKIFHQKQNQIIFKHERELKRK